MKMFASLLLISTVLVASSCNKDDDDQPNNIVNFSATLNGASEVPANASTATGTATGSYNTDTKILTVSINYTGLTPTAGHIHKAAAGANGSVIFPFTTLISPINYTTVALDATQQADLMGNLYYVNLHTAAIPAGEIRGQLLKR